MRIFIMLGMAAALAGCSPADKGQQQQQSQQTAGTAATRTPADKFEIRLLVPKASLPASLTAAPSAKDKPARTAITGRDLAAIEAVIGGRVPPGSIPGPHCFKVCESQCFAVGNSQTCYPTCHIECID